MKLPRALLLLSAVLLTGCAVVGIDHVYAASAEPIAHTVEIKGFQFFPEVISVKPGDSITWKNLDIVPHTTTANDNSWTSPELKSGESHTLHVTSDMFEGYFCRYHPSMTATLKIGTE